MQSFPSRGMVYADYVNFTHNESTRRYLSVEKVYRHILVEIPPQPGIGQWLNAKATLTMFIITKLSSEGYFFNRGEFGQILPGFHSSPHFKNWMREVMINQFSLCGLKIDNSNEQTPEVVEVRRTDRLNGHQKNAPYRILISISVYIG
jgi:hypothetical protein